MTDPELEYVLAALSEIVENHGEWEKDYHYDSSCNEFRHTAGDGRGADLLDRWFSLED